MSNDFVFRKTLNEIVASKVEPFLEKIFAQCNFESVQTSLLIEELVDSFSDEENYSTFQEILTYLFHPHVALTFDQLKKDHFFKKLVNLLHKNKFTPVYNERDEEAVEPKFNKEDEIVIEETCVNKLLPKKAVCTNNIQNGSKTEVVNDSVNHGILFKNELEELKCENQYLKSQNEILITGNPHAHCEIMNQQLMEELKQLEVKLQTKKREQEKTQEKQFLQYDKEMTQETQTDEFLSKLQDNSNDEGKVLQIVKLEEMNVSHSKENGEISGSKNLLNVTEMEEENNASSIEWKIHQINVEKNQLLEENAMLKKEIEIRKKLRDTEISGDHMKGKCDHVDLNSTGTFEDLEGLMSSIQTLEEENQAKDSLIKEYESQLYELKCYVKLTRQPSSSPITLNSESFPIVQECRASKSLQEELIDLELVVQDKNKTDSELLKLHTEVLKQNFEFISHNNSDTSSQDVKGNSRLYMFDYEHSTTSEEDCDVSRISHWDCGQMIRNSSQLLHFGTPRCDRTEKSLLVQTPTRDSPSETNENFYTCALLDNTDPNIDCLPSPMRPECNTNMELNSEEIQEMDLLNFNPFHKKRELIPRQLVCNVLSNSIPEETSDERSTDSKCESSAETKTEESQEVLFGTSDEISENTQEASHNLEKILDVSEIANIKGEIVEETGASLTPGEFSEVSNNSMGKIVEKMESTGDFDEEEVICGSTEEISNSADESCILEKISRMSEVSKNKGEMLEIAEYEEESNEQELISENEKELISENEQAVVSENKQEVISEYKQEVVSEIEQKLVTDNEQEVVSEIEQEVVSKNEQEVISDNEQEVVSEIEREVISKNEHELISENEQEVSENEQEVSQNEQEVISEYKQEVVSEIEQELVTENEQELVTDNEQEVVSEIEQEVVSKNEQEVISDNEQKVVSEIEQEVISKNEHELISENEQEVSENEQEVISEYKQEVVLDNEQEVISDNEQEVISDNEPEVVSDNEQEVVSEIEQEVVSKNDQEVISDNEQEVVSDNEQEVVSEIEQEVVSKNEQEVISDNEQEVVSDNEQEVVSEIEQEVVKNEQEVVSDNEQEVVSEIEQLILKNDQEVVISGNVEKSKIQETLLEILKKENNLKELLTTSKENEIQGDGLDKKNDLTEDSTFELQEKDETAEESNGQEHSEKQNDIDDSLPLKEKKIKKDKLDKEYDRTKDSTFEVKKKNHADKVETINKGQHWHFKESRNVIEVLSDSSDSSMEHYVFNINRPMDTEHILNSVGRENSTSQENLINPVLDLSEKSNEEKVEGIRIKKKIGTVLENNEIVDDVESVKLISYTRVDEPEQSEEDNDSHERSLVLLKDLCIVSSSNINHEHKNTMNSKVQNSDAGTQNSKVVIQKLTTAPGTSFQLSSACRSPKSCSDNCNQCVNVKEAIDLFENWYRTNLNSGECSGHTVCNRKSGKNSCKNHKYSNIFDRMNDKLKEMDFQSNGNSSFNRYRDPGHAESRHLLTETLHKCLTEMNESFSAESGEDKHDAVDLNELIKDFNCMHLHEEPIASSLSEAPQIRELKRTHPIIDDSTSAINIANATKHKSDKANSAVPKKSSKSNKVIKRIPRSTNQNHAMNNLQTNSKQNKTLKGNITRVANNITQTISLPAVTNDLNDSLSLVPTSKEIVKNANFDGNSTYDHRHKRNNIESSYSRKTNNIDRPVKSDVNDRSVKLYQRQECSKTVNQALHVDSTIGRTSKSTSLSHDARDTITMVGTTIGRFSLYLIRLLGSLVILFFLLLLALIWYQEVGRRKCTACSQLAAFLGDLLPTKIQHLDGPPPI